MEFPRNAVPKIYDALKLKSGGALVLEVQQQLGDGIIRAIAMGSSDGLQRGLDVINTGKPISSSSWYSNSWSYYGCIR